MLTLRGRPYGDASPGEPTACFLDGWSPISLKDLRFRGEMVGGGMDMLNMASAARRHWFMLRPGALRAR